LPLRPGEFHLKGTSRRWPAADRGRRGSILCPWSSGSSTRTRGAHAETWTSP